MLLSRALNLTHTQSPQPELESAEPASDSLTSRLWAMNTKLAEASFNSLYVQGIGQGDLNPDDYSRYKVVDVIYVYHGLEDCKVALGKALDGNDADLIYFLHARVERLKGSVSRRENALNISDPNAVYPTKAAQAYIDLEHRVAETLPPVYYVLAAVPCLRLWAWMTSILMPQATPGNIYREWITKNNDWSGAYQLENFVNSWFAANPSYFDEASARDVYQGCMLGEANFFREACGQKLINASGNEV